MYLYWCACVNVYGSVCIYNIYVCVYLCMCGGTLVYARVACVYGYMCECIMCVDSPSSLYIWLRVIAILDSFVRSELGNKRFGVVLVMDPIHWRFKD